MTFIINSDTEGQSPGSVVSWDLEIGQEEQLMATDWQGDQGDLSNQDGHQDG